MHVLVIGAAGMIGRKLVQRLARDPHIGGKPIERMTLQDVIEPEAPKGASFKVTKRAGDITVPGEAAALVADAPGLIFHLAAIVSGEAETDFEKGYRINLDGMRFLLEAIRARAAISRRSYSRVRSPSSVHRSRTLSPTSST